MDLKVPNHVAVIMDGNGRWAKRRGLDRTCGHQEGSKRVKEVAREAKKKGIKVLTLFTFSTENWNRPKEEISYLFSYLKSFLDGYKKELIEKKIRFKAFGRRDRIDEQALRKIEETEEATRDNKDFFLNIALDYGGRWDITNAVAKILDLIEKSELSRKQIDEKKIGSFLSLADLKDPDILVRTSGEKRISNFLIWQCAYTEFYFPQVLWPDFGAEWVGRIIEEYSKRIRKFGKIDA